MGYNEFLKEGGEKKWQQFWKKNKTFRAEKLSSKPKYYVLDMFPYPSGAGLHVGHPLGYIATDIVARYKWTKGFNVLHPMGFDAFGLPAEQYAIETGTHPAITTEKNIQRYKEQLDILGMAYDPETELRTCEPGYYKWTQWIFLQLFNSWYNLKTNKAEAIESLIHEFENKGNAAIKAVSDQEKIFSAEEWNAYTEDEKQVILLRYRLCYTTEGLVNWCPELGTVLANDEVIDGKSERGGHPVFRMPMRQWVQRMTAYAERLRTGLDTLDWPEPLKEMQRNWIGKSEGAKIFFEIEDHPEKLEIFTTRPDTIFGATFMVIAPEHEWVNTLTQPNHKKEVDEIVERAAKKSEIDRMADVKTISGAFTGSYCLHPFSGKKIPIWVGDYVLASYGTGAIMAVPAHDSRDYRFARHFNIEIVEVVSGGNISEEAFEGKTGILINSYFLNGLEVKAAISRAIIEIEKKSIGESKVLYKLRDPNFSRQRYWGEPFPIKLKGEIPYALSEANLPVTLPETQNFKPAGNGESPLAHLPDWVNLPDGFLRETHTMPGYAGSSWYFLRYPDAHNDKAFVDADIEKYWMNVDLYVGGSEHAVGHLLYSRFWTKFLFDRGLISVEEPFKKLVNQGMIQGRSSLINALQVSFYSEISKEIEPIIPTVYLSKGLGSIFTKESDTEERFSKLRKIIHQKYKILNKGLIIGEPETQFLSMPWKKRIPIDLVENDTITEKALEDYLSKEKLIPMIICEDENGNPTLNGKFMCDYEIEKMSKRWHNVVNPDDICAKYGADTFRLYEMFLGPLEVSKPFITNGIEGTSRFLRKTWNLFFDENDNLKVNQDSPSKEELKVLHQTLKKIEEDIERLSFNTSVSQFMICVNTLQDLKCNKKEILEPFLISLAPFAPHFCEEIWQKLGHSHSIIEAKYPVWNEEYMTELNFDYPVSINGKVRSKLNLPLNLSKDQLEKKVMNWPELAGFLDNRPIKKLIVVPGRIINVVV